MNKDNINDEDDNEEKKKKSKRKEDNRNKNKHRGDNEMNRIKAKLDELMKKNQKKSKLDKIEDNKDEDRLGEMEEIKRRVESTPEKVRQGEEFRREGLALLARSKALYTIGIVLMERANLLATEQNDHLSGKVLMTFERLEEWYNEVNIVNNGIMEIGKTLEEFSTVYDDLRNRVNSFYNYEMMGEYKDILNKIGEMNIDSSEDIEDKKDEYYYTSPDEESGEDYNKDGGFKEGNADWWKKG